MKKICIYVIVLAFMGCTQSAKGPNGVVYNTVVEYNDYIVNRQTYILTSLKRMVDMMSTSKSAALNMLPEISSSCLKTASEIEGMPAWKGNTNFRDKAVGMFRFYGTTYTTDFKELIQLASNPEISEAERATLTAKGESIDKEEAKMNQGFLKAQKEFSEANNLRLEDKGNIQ